MANLPLMYGVRFRQHIQPAPENHALPLRVLPECGNPKSVRHFAVRALLQNQSL
jgi:hypothetical protein